MVWLLSSSNISHLSMKYFSDTLPLSSTYTGCCSYACSPLNRTAAADQNRTRRGKKQLQWEAFDEKRLTGLLCAACNKGGHRLKLWFLQRALEHAKQLENAIGCGFEHALNNGLQMQLTVLWWHVWCLNALHNCNARPFWPIRTRSSPCLHFIQDPTNFVLKSIVFQSLSAILPQPSSPSSCSSSSSSSSLPGSASSTTSTSSPLSVSSLCSSSYWFSWLIRATLRNTLYWI